jgi:predicted acylesterase/phospholipase RssA
MSIPPLFPKTEIDGCHYIDGAFGWASPVVPLLSAANVTDPHCVVVIDGESSQLNTHNMTMSNDIIAMMSKYMKRLGHQKINSDIFFLVERLKFLAQISNVRVSKMEIVNPTNDDWLVVRDTVYSSKYTVLIVSPLYYRGVRLYEIDYNKSMSVMDMCKKYSVLTLHYTHTHLT